MDNIQPILSRLVGIKTYYPYEHLAHQYLSDFLQKSGFSVKKQKVSTSRFNLLAKRGKGKKSVLIYMHIDTVAPADTDSKMPFSLTKKGDKLLGLGSFDMKGGIAAILSIINSPELSGHYIKLAFCIDEEGISTGVHQLIKSSFLDDVEIAFCPEASIISSDWPLPVVIVLGGRGRCRLEVVVPGISAHGAQSHEGVNAIEQAALLIGQLHHLPAKVDPKLGQSSWFVSSINSQNEMLSIPDKAVVQLDYQLVTGQTPESVRSDLKGFITELYRTGVLESSLKNRYQVQIMPRGTPYALPYQVSETNKYVKQVQSLSKQLYNDSQCDYTKSVADANVLTNAGIPTITIGPIGGNPHHKDEWVSESSLKELTNFYKRLFNQMAK